MPRLSSAEPTLAVAALGRSLRHAGVRVGTGQLVDFARAAALVGPARTYWAGRATLVSRPEERDVFDRVFSEWLAQLPSGTDEPEPRPAIDGADVEGEGSRPAERLYDLDEVNALPEGRTSTRTDAAIGTAEEEELSGAGAEPEGNARGRASADEILRHKNFDRIPAEDLADLERLIASLRVGMPARRSRRRRHARHGELDPRTTIRRGFRHGGEPTALARRDRRERPRRLVLLLDVSGSMAGYSRALLVLAHAALRAGRNWEAFAFGTRLTRVTRPLRGLDPEAAMERAVAEVVDWDGGTRIGESLKTFLDRYGSGGLARGSIVAIASDGLEDGSPRLLGEQMERLSRLAFRVVWLDPMKQISSYRPTAPGLVAALPYIDVLESGHNLASIEALERELAHERARRPSHRHEPFLARR